MIYHLLAFITISIWGTTFVSTKMLLTYGLTPAAIFFMRFAMAYIGMAAAQCIQNRRLRRLNGGSLESSRRWFCHSWRDELKMVVAGMAGGSVYFLTENTALQKAMAGNVSLIVCLAPLITALFARLFHFEKQAEPKLWFGSVIAFVGVAFVAYGSTGHGTASAPLQGNVLALMAAMSWSLYQLIIKPLGSKYGTLTLTRKVFGYGILSIAPVVCFEAPIPWQVLSTPVVWGNLVFLGLVASLLCYAVWNKVTERIGALVTANYIYLNPLVTCIASYLVLDERLTASMMVGGIAILTGLYIVIAPKRHGRKQAH